MRRIFRSPCSTGERSSSIQMCVRQPNARAVSPIGEVWFLRKYQLSSQIHSEHHLQKCRDTLHLHKMPLELSFFYGFSYWQISCFVSCMLAAWTTTDNRLPIVSTTICILRPFVFSINSLLSACSFGQFPLRPDPFAHTWIQWLYFSPLFICYVCIICRPLLFQGIHVAISLFFYYDLPLLYHFRLIRTSSKFLSPATRPTASDRGHGFPTIFPADGQPPHRQVIQPVYSHNLRFFRSRQTWTGFADVCRMALPGKFLIGFALTTDFAVMPLPFHLICPTTILTLSPSLSQSNLSFFLQTDKDNLWAFLSGHSLQMQ